MSIESNRLRRTFSMSGMLSNLRVVSLGTLTSRLLGLIRDIGMTTVFGAGTTLDAFIVAFRLPNLARQLFGEGALTTAFLPVYLQDRTQNGEQAARSTLTAVAIVLATLLAGAVLIVELMGMILLLTVPLAESSRLLLWLLMVLMPYMMFICMAALFCAALHAQRQFFWPAIVPIVLNVLWLIGLAVAWSGLNDDVSRATMVGVFVVLAGLAQMLLPIVVLFRSGTGFTRHWRKGLPRVKEVFLVMLPVVGGLAVMQLNTVLDSLMAWALARPDGGGPAWSESIGIPPLVESGTATALYIGQRMYQFPLGVFGVALGTVLFPLLTQHALRGEQDLLRTALTRGMRLVIAIALPASAGLYVLAKPLTLVLFRHGAFSAEDARLAADMIAVYGAGVWIYISLVILNRAFYAIGDRITPMRLGLLTLTLNVLLNALLVWLIGGIGLAWGSVLAALFQLVMTALQLHRQIGPFDGKALGATLLRGLVATAGMSAACLAVLSRSAASETFSERLTWLLLPVLVGMGTYFLAARLLGLNEVFELTRRQKGASRTSDG